MRIVAGVAKGRRLAPVAAGTRPTSDRARESLFNSLTGLLDLDGAAVLDLYAGTGAVGLEALSRGAATATFVEANARAATVLSRNVATLGLPGATVVRRRVETFFAGPDTGGPYDFVFADPPYALPDEALAGVLARLTVPIVLAPDAVVVVERSANGPGPAWPDCVTPLRERRYGEGVLWYGRARWPVS